MNIRIALLDRRLVGAAAFHCDNLPVQEIEIKDRSGLVPCSDDRRAYVVSRAEIDVLPNGGRRECLERRWQQVHGLRAEFVGDTAPNSAGNDLKTEERRVGTEGVRPCR